MKTLIISLCLVSASLVGCSDNSDSKYCTKTIDHVHHNAFGTTWYSTDGYHTVYYQDERTTAVKGDEADCYWTKN